MAWKKAHEVEAWLKSEHPDVRIVLIYGPDRGMVSERAKDFAASTGLAGDDPFSVLKLDASELANDAARLIDEARTISMFGDNRLLWLRNASNDKSLAGAITALCDDPPRDAVLLIEAGDLKKGSALRRIVEHAKAAMALPCYADTPKMIDGLIDRQLVKAGLGIGLEARQLLKSLLGGDRLASRGEIEKLLLYCQGKTMIETEDVVASMGDVSAISQDTIIDSVLSGDPKGFDLAYTRFAASGAAPFLALSSMLRKLQLLQRLRHESDSGSGSVQSIVVSARPPIFFSRRKVMENAVSRWNGPMISRALDRLQQAILTSRSNTSIATSLCRQTMLSLCLESARGARRK